MPGRARPRELQLFCVKSSVEGAAAQLCRGGHPGGHHTTHLELRCTARRGRPGFRASDDIRCPGSGRASSCARSGRDHREGGDDRSTTARLRCAMAATRSRNQQQRDWTHAGQRPAARPPSRRYAVGHTAPIPLREETAALLACGDHAALSHHTRHRCGSSGLTTAGYFTSPCAGGMVRPRAASASIGPIRSPETK